MLVCHQMILRSAKYLFLGSALLLLFGVGFAQQFSFTAGLQGGVSIPNNSVLGNNLLKRGGLGGLDIGGFYKKNGRIKTGISSGLYFSRLRKNTSVIVSDCITPPYVTYQSPQDSLNGRDLKIMDIPIQGIIRYEVVPEGLFFQAGLGFVWHFKSWVETFATKDCHEHSSTFIPYNPDDGVKVNGISGLFSFSIGHQIGSNFSLEVYSQFYLSPKVRVNAFPSGIELLRLRPGNLGFRIGVEM